MRTIHALNGHKETTIAELEKARAKAKGKAKADLAALIRALSPNRRPVAVPQKGASTVKHTKKRAAKKAARKTSRKFTRKAKHNPSGVVTAAKHHARRAAAKVSGIMATVKSLDIPGVMVDAAVVTAGALGTSFADRQAARLFPNLNPYLRIAGAGLTVGALAVVLGGKKHGRLALVAALSEAARAAAEQAMPGMFAGSDYEPEAVGALAPGYFDERGQWVDLSGAAELDAEEVQGIVYRDEYAGAERPDGF